MSDQVEQAQDRRDRSAAMRRAFGSDVELWARFTDLWWTEQRPLGMNELAWALGPVTEGKVAVSMKYAVAEGFARRTSARGDQGEWEPTDKAKAAFPQTGPQVMPEIPGALPTSEAKMLDPQAALGSSRRGALGCGGDPNRE